ncbi:MAG: P-loop NTPase fold protein [bacterium]
MNEHIIDYLNYYINLENPQYAVLLKGKWGCGKTFFIKNQKEKWIDFKEKNDEIRIQPIYVSLNGIENVKTVNDRIRAEINPFLYSKGMQVAKQVFNGLLKSTAKIDLNFGKDDESDGSLTFNIDSLGIFDNKNSEIKGKRILIFDDIERCKIPTDEIFGYINHFVEHSRCKVILVADEEKIKAKYKEDKKEFNVSYKEFKEKLIGQTFEVKSDVDNAITHFIHESQKLKRNKDVSEYKELIKAIFISSGLENLRVLKQALLDFNRFTSFLEDSIVKNSNYKEFIKNLLSYFIIVYAEHKTGNEKIKNFQGFNFSDEEKAESSKMEAKYNPILNKYNIHYSSSVIQISTIINYIEKGFLNPTSLNNELKTNDFFREDTEQDWEKLWSWRFIDDKEFKKLRSSVWTTFYKGEIYDTTILLHIFGILINLVNNNLLDKSKTFILKKSKRIIENIITQNQKASINKNYGIFEGAYGKQYQAIETDEYKELRDFLLKKIENQQAFESSSYLKDIFENLTDTNIDRIYRMLSEAVPDRRTTYENTPIFKNVDGRVLGRTIKKLNSKSIFDFKSFLHYRYFPEEKYSNVTLEKYHKEDLGCLEKFQKEISINLKKREKIKNRMLQDLNKELLTIIDKINKIE